MNDETVTCTPDKLVSHSKKRDASSPLQHPSLELKKSKINTSPLSRAEEPEGSDMTSKSGETVLTEQDLNNIAAKMQDIFLLAVQKMIVNCGYKISLITASNYYFEQEMSRSPHINLEYICIF